MITHFIVLVVLVFPALAFAQSLPPAPVDGDPQALGTGQSVVASVDPDQLNAFLDFLLSASGAPPAANSKGRGRKKSKSADASDVDQTQKFEKETPLAGFSKLRTKKNGRLLRTGTGLAQTMVQLQQNNLPAAVATLSEILNQLDAARAADPRVREGKQCAATRSAFQVGQNLLEKHAPNGDPTTQGPGAPPADCTLLINAVAAAQKQSSPILLDLNFNGIADVTTPDHTGDRGAFVAKGAVRFDVTGRGRSNRFEWLKSNADGLLALDRNGNGLVDDSTELFGDSDGFADGYARLSLLDRNGDGALTGNELAGLAAWVDNGNGLCEPGELRQLSSIGVTRLGVKHQAYVSSFEMNGRVGKTWDWFPRFQ
jgi:hypothetical protein